MAHGRSSVLHQAQSTEAPIRSGVDCGRWTLPSPLKASVTEYALGEPQNGIVEIAGLDKISLSVLVEQFLSLTNDAHEVVTDVNAPYFGAILQNEVLLPSNSARLAPTDFKTWFDRSEYAQAA